MYIYYIYIYIYILALRKFRPKSGIGWPGIWD